MVDPDDYRLYSWADWSRQRPREGEPFLQAVTFRMRVPEILTLRHFDRPREEAVTFSRRNLFKRDHATCQYCGSPPRVVGADHRPRPAPRPGRGLLLGELRPGLRGVQRPQGQPHPRAGADEAARRSPHRPSWKPHYAASGVRIESWSRVLSEAYWNVTLED